MSLSPQTLSRVIRHRHNLAGWPTLVKEYERREKLGTNF